MNFENSRVATLTAMHSWGGGWNLSWLLNSFHRPQGPQTHFFNKVAGKKKKKKGDRHWNWSSVVLKVAIINIFIETVYQKWTDLNRDRESSKPSKGPLSCTESAIAMCSLSKLWIRRLKGPICKDSQLVKYWWVTMVTDRTYNPKASIMDKVEMRVKNQLSHKLDP